jgi:polysaccharide biosynthesis protein PslG
VHASGGVRRLGILFAVILLSNACVPAGEQDSTPRSEASRHLAFAILEDYDKGDDLADIRLDFASFRELGITTWRGSLGWDDFEPSRGKYDFGWLHRFADAAAQDGIELRPYVAYTPQWAAAGGADGDPWNDPPRSLDDWGRFVNALATALRSHVNVRSLEIYNEENVPQWWDGTPAEYGAVLERAAREVRAANPRLQVILGGMVFPDVEWLEQICAGHREKPLIDALPFHAYPETWTPPGVDLERYLGPRFRAEFVAAADSNCGRLPIWVNEAGFATLDRTSELAQAAWWARAIATFASEPRIEQIGVYEIKDLAPEREAIGGTPNYHLGLERVDRSRKPAFSTVQMLVSLLSGGFDPFQPAIAMLGPSADAEIFARGFRLEDGRQLLVAWCKRTGVRVSLTAATRGRTARERLLTGGSRGVAAFDGSTLTEVALEPGTVRLFEVLP